MIVAVHHLNWAQSEWNCNNNYAHKKPKRDFRIFYNVNSNQLESSLEYSSTRELIWKTIV